MKEPYLQYPIIRKAYNEVLVKNFRTFFSSEPPREYPSILRGIFNYNETFTTFIKGTLQKEETALLIGNFTKKLKENYAYPLRQRPLRVADIGCANSATCLQYLKKMNHSPGFYYFGIDTNRKFLLEAKEMLSSNPIIKKYTLIEGDALSGKLKEKKEFSYSPFEFIFISHIAYCITDELSGRLFLEDITKLLLDEYGIAIFFHEDSTYHFRSTYNRSQFGAMSAPALLQRAAHSLPIKFNQFKTIKFTSKLHFFPLAESLWEAIKNPKLYRNFSNQPEFINTLEKLAFIVQRDLTELDKEGCLTSYIEEIKDAIKDNNNCLDLETSMQTLVTPKCTLRHKIARALKETEEEIPKILAIEKINEFANKK